MYGRVATEDALVIDENPRRAGNSPTFIRLAKQILAPRVASLSLKYFLQRNGL
jgi:hypothetical protein